MSKFELSKNDHAFCAARPDMQSEAEIAEVGSCARNSRDLAYEIRTLQLVQLTQLYELSATRGACTLNSLLTNTILKRYGSESPFLKIFHWFFSFLKFFSLFTPLGASMPTRVGDGHWWFFELFRLLLLDRAENESSKVCQKVVRQLDRLS